MAKKKKVVIIEPSDKIAELRRKLHQAELHGFGDEAKRIGERLEREIAKAAK